MAGIIFDRSKLNTTTYIYTNDGYWIMTPSHLSNNNGTNTYMFHVSSKGRLLNSRLVTGWSVGSVINLKSDTVFEKGGQGISINQYVVKETQKNII